MMHECFIGPLQHLYFRESSDLHNGFGGRASLFSIRLIKYKAHGGSHQGLNPSNNHNITEGFLVAMISNHSGYDITNAIYM